MRITFFLYHDDSSTICFVMITGSSLTMALSDAETKIPIPEEESQETVTKSESGYLLANSRIAMRSSLCRITSLIAVRLSLLVDWRLLSPAFRFVSWHRLVVAPVPSFLLPLIGLPQFPSVVLSSYFHSFAWSSWSK